MTKTFWWQKIFTKTFDDKNHLMTSSSYLFYDVIKIRQLNEVEDFLAFLLNILTTVPLIFTQLMSFLSNQLQYILKLKDWIQVIHCCHGNQFMKECLAKNHDRREEKWYFLDFELILRFKLRFQIRCPKLPLTPNFSVIHPKTKKQWRLSTMLVVATSKWQISRHTFELQMTAINFFLNSTRFLFIILLPSFCIIWLESEKYEKNLPLWSCFYPRTSLH